MPDYAEIELGLHGLQQDGMYELDFRFSQADSEAEVRPILTPIQIDLQKLNACADDPAQYGRMLAKQIFSDRTGAEFGKARAVAMDKNIPLRFRLLISASAEELNTVRWETLMDPASNGNEVPLLTSQNVLFSRYVQSAEWRPTRVRPAEGLKALVVVANPRNLSLMKSAQPLAAIDVNAELVSVRSALQKFKLTELQSRGTATLDSMMQKLRDESFDVLYVICHGALRRGESVLILEDEAGDLDVVAGHELTKQLREIENQPRLIVLAACQTAENTIAADGAYLNALGPQLAEAGIPAVVAMQGSITSQSALAFMHSFFAELDKGGQVDRAMSAGRATIREASDTWMPVLYMRLKTGRIWFDHDMEIKSRASFQAWDALLNNIVNQRCTPIIGQGVYEPLLGRFRDIARRWADAYRYPFPFNNNDDLPQIAQYLLVTNANDFFYPRDELKNYFKRELVLNFGDLIEKGFLDRPLDELITHVWTKVADADDPQRVLAALPCPLYVTATFATVLEHALTEQKKTPISAICPWNDSVEVDVNAIPSKLVKEQPVVYHLFGRLDAIGSIVLTEDDYFEYLIGTTRKADLIPANIRNAFTSSALLFLGFEMTDWNFRVLFRSIMKKEGRLLSKRFAHVAVQIDPQRPGIQEPEIVYRYFEQSFQESQISIYWGTVSDFMKTLKERWQDKFGEPLVTA